jgi:hypothetical protein
VKNIKIVPFFFLLIALFLAAGVPVFANTEVLSQTTSEEKHSFQTDRNAKALFIEEIGPSELFQPLTKRYSVFGFNSTGVQGIYFGLKKDLVNIVSVPIRDQRRLISQYIYPFHFFW